MKELGLEPKIRLRYNIPTHLKYSKYTETHIECQLCRDPNIFFFSAPFLTGNVPVSDIASLIKTKFNIDVSPDMISAHRSHFSASYDFDLSLRDRQRRESELIESSVVGNLENLDDVISDTISSLHARMLELRANGEVNGKDFIETSKSLMGWVSLKKKLDGELTEGGTTDFSNLVKLEDNDDRERQVVRESTIITEKQAISSEAEPNQPIKNSSIK